MVLVESACYRQVVYTKGVGFWYLNCVRLDNRDINIYCLYLYWLDLICPAAVHNSHSTQYSQYITLYKNSMATGRILKLLNTDTVE